MSNIEEDYKVFQLVKRNPINSCKDLSKNMIGKKRGIFYFTELFRIDFENKMSDFERLKEEREQDKKRIKELEESCKDCIIREELDDYVSNSIPVQKVKDKIEKLKTDLRFIACNKDCSKCFNKEGKALYRESDFIFCYAYHQIKILQELLEDK